MSECPTCGRPVTAAESVCPGCGAALVGATESFPAIEADLVGGREPDVSVEGPALVVRKGHEVGERFLVDRSRLTIGRDPEADIFLNDVTVSRAHAVLECVGSDVRIVDAGSLNGTYVNGVCVDAAQLSPGDLVQIGMFQMVFVGGGSA